MKIIKLVVDDKPLSCLACPLVSMHSCGKEKANKGNGYVQYIKAPDSRCYIEEINNDK